MYIAICSYMVNYREIIIFIDICIVIVFVTNFRNIYHMHELKVEHVHTDLSSMSILWSCLTRMSPLHPPPEL